MNAHPDDQALLQWLETNRPTKVGRHVEACDECLDRVDALSGLDGEVRAGLDSASAPPPDLGARTSGAVHGRLAAEEAVASALDLFAIPWQTLSVLIDPDAPPRADARADRPGSGPQAPTAFEHDDEPDDEHGERTDG